MYDAQSLSRYIYTTKITMKKILITTLVSSIALTTSAFADTDTIYIPQAPAFSSVYHVNENKEEIKVTNNEAKAKKRASKIIDERIKSLEGNSEVIAKNKKLTTEQKSVLTTTLQSEVTKLTALNVSVASSTSATTTKMLIDSVFSDYRIYGVVIPKVRLDVRIYQLKNHAATLSETFSKLQVKIDEQKAKGNDTTSWQKGLDDAKVLVAQDMFKLDELLKKTATLTPASYGTTSKAIIESVGSDIKIITKDFTTIVSKVRTPAKMKKAAPVATVATSTVNGATTTIASTTVR